LDFGKLPNIDNIDFKLPSDPDCTEKLLQSIPGKGKLYFGVTAWSDKGYNGNLYPVTAKSREFLQLYARQYNTVELNATHYAIPNPDQLIKWRESVPAEFAFCPKLPQLISHRNDFGLLSGALSRYIDAIRQSGESLGLQFLQLPPDFGPDKIGLLSKFCKEWPAQMPLAVEFRHPDWFKTSEVWELIHQHGIGTVITDVSGRRDVCHMALTAPYVIIRYVGNSLHVSDKQRMHDWINRINQWTQSKIAIYFMLHQPDIPSLAAMSVSMSLALRNSGHDIPQVTLHGGGKQLGLF
jgi:uncharacterized protein YecE (DUF72 family)